MRAVYSIGTRQVLPTRNAIIGGKGDDEGRVILITDESGYNNSIESVLKPADAIRLGLYLIRQAITEGLRLG